MSGKTKSRAAAKPDTLHLTNGQLAAAHGALDALAKLGLPTLGIILSINRLLQTMQPEAAVIRASALGVQASAEKRTLPNGEESYVDPIGLAQQLDALHHARSPWVDTGVRIAVGDLPPHEDKPGDSEAVLAKKATVREQLGSIIPALGPMFVDATD